jgi:hypothetical protein
MDGIFIPPGWRVKDKSHPEVGKSPNFGSDAVG